ncbi:uncharacterized protein LOC110464724 [Mizuhopecten yessoensis]|uniref:HECT domain-containing protein n=1 Tax=Mizuhopecten yessoensis TaxID=6573 RepID=A0A210PT68_MIZYE|nr:uncharacterized protein LOC110464724 [Mizuhopecten yessoensis]OWF39690.1 hypothetical protein KP79_PYT19108 [Mizuhopecten yessoensis]
MAYTAEEAELRVRQLHSEMCKALHGYIHPSLQDSWEVFKFQLSIYLTPRFVQQASRSILTAMQVLEEKHIIRVGEYSALRDMVKDIHIEAARIIDNFTRQISEVRANVTVPPPHEIHTSHPIQEQGVPGQVQQTQATHPVEPQGMPDPIPIFGGGAYFDYQPETDRRLFQEVDGFIDVPEPVYQRDGAVPPFIQVPGADAEPEGQIQELRRGQAEVVNQLDTDDANRVEQFSPNIAQCMEALQGSIGDEIQHVDLNRQSILANLLDLYNDETIVTKRLYVRFVGEIGMDTGGLTKDAFSTFWDRAFREYFRGENSLVPYLGASKFAEAQRVYPILGRILSHSVALTGTFPVRLSRCMLYTMIHSAVVEDEESILKDVLLFLTPNERMLTRKGLADFDNLTQGNVSSLLDMFTRYSLTGQPKKENFRQNILNLGKTQLCGTCMMFTTWMKSGIPPSHLELFWNRLNIEELNRIYRVLEPTPQRVIDRIETDVEHLREEEDRVFYFLKDFISVLCPEDLSHFLVFLTGSDALPQDSPIKVLFSRVEGLAMHPVAHTCSNTLELPVGYTSSQELRRDFMTILNNPESYSMTIL